MAVNEYDVIVIGGGHNGLVSAACFGRAGARTLVLEARDRVGGAADTSTPFPEFPDGKVSTYSYVVSVLPRRIVRDLELERHGYHLYLVWGAMNPFSDGRSIEIYNEDLRRTCESIAQFSKRDTERYPEWRNWIEQAGAVIGPLLVHVPPRVGSRSFGDLLGPSQLAWKMRKLSVRGAADLKRLLTMSITDLLDEWFESEQLKVAIAATGVIGAWAGPDASGTAFVLLHNVISDVGDGGLDSWGYPRGGMGAVSTAIRSSAESAGCQVRTAARVARILTKGGRVLGAVLDRGEEFRAPVVVSAVHPKLAFLRLLERRELPTGFVADIERAFQDAHIGLRGATPPFSDGCIPSSLDTGLMPEGIHFCSMLPPYFPHEWSDAPHREDLEAYADRVIDGYTELAPNLKRSLIDRQVLGPYDIEQDLGMIGGNIFRGEVSPDQLFHLRPAPGYADYRAPIRGLYNASSGAHGGGGVNGIPGLQAFRQARRDGVIRS